MPGLNGFDVLERLPARRPVVIFSTAYDEYALRAFEAHAIDYLLKPFTNRRFRDALEHAKAMARLTKPGPPRDSGRSTYLEHIAVRTSVGVTLVPVAQIDWIEAAADYVRIHTEAKTFLLRSPIGQLEARLDPAVFVRVHRATIVNLTKMTELKVIHGEAFVALLPHGARRRVSRQGRAHLERVLGQRL
jgi:two-component system, LytTR family, response regulator